jgi:hypothetical protein
MGARRLIVLTIEDSFHDDIDKRGLHHLVRRGHSGLLRQELQYGISAMAVSPVPIPAGSNDISSSALKVDPGDTVKITVETTGAGATKATFIDDDETKGQTDQSSLTAASVTCLSVI